MTDILSQVLYFESYQGAPRHKTVLRWQIILEIVQYILCYNFV